MIAVSSTPAVIAVLLAHFTVVSPKVFHLCLEDKDGINEPVIICPHPTQIINITSAKVGFGHVASSNDSLARCTATDPTCVKPTDHRDIVACNGQRSSCRFDLSVLRYPPHDKLCSQHQHGNFITVNYDCIDVYTFRRCRAANASSDYVLILGRCKPDQVIYIRKAIIGFSEEWDPADSRPRCGFRKSCAKSTRHDEITSCNSRQRCSFSQDVFNFPSNRSCHRSTIANFIVVTYYCITPKSHDDVTTSSSSAVTVATSSDGCCSTTELEPILNGSVSNRSNSRESTNASSSSNGSLSIGAITAIVVMSFLLLLMITILLIIVIHTYRRRRGSPRRFKLAVVMASVNFENDRPNGHADETTTDQNHSSTDTASTPPES